MNEYTISVVLVCEDGIVETDQYRLTASEEDMDRLHRVLVSEFPSIEIREIDY